MPEHFVLRIIIVDKRKDDATENDDKITAHQWIDIAGYTQQPQDVVCPQIGCHIECQGHGSSEDQ